MRKILASTCLAFLLIACEEEETRYCTLMGCDDQLTLTASSALGSRYGVEITLNGQTISVACDIPADAASARANVTGSSIHMDCTPTGLVMYDLPAQLTARFLDEDGTILGQGQVVPDYETQYLNGVECGAVCDQGEDVVQTVPAANPNPKS